LKAGALLGLGILAKLTMVALIPAFGLVIVFRALDSNNNWRGAVRRLIILGLTSAGACLVVAGWWLARNLIEYGDISGSTAALRWYSSHLTHADFSSLQKISDFCSATFMSFVGLFSWDAIVFPEAVYRVAEAIVLAFVLLSWVALVSLAQKRTIVPTDMKRGIAILGLASLCVLAEYIQFNVSISYQPQARYLFVLLVPISLALIGGIYILVRDSKVKAAWVLLAVPPCLLVLLNWMAISMLSST
jgi:hypothetical protein